MCVDSCQIPIFVSNENIDLTAQAEKRDFCQLSKVKHLTWWRRTEFYTSCPTSQWMFIVEDFNMSSYSLKKRQVKVGWIDNDGSTRRIVKYNCDFTRRTYRADWSFCKRSKRHWTDALQLVYVLSFVLTWHKNDRKPKRKPSSSTSTLLATRQSKKLLGGCDLVTDSVMLFFGQRGGSR